MKRTSLLLAVSIQLSVFGQGPLTPPAPPGPTMKTLDQVEPRTPITNLPVTISQRGSYYVTTNLTGASGNGITIDAHDVAIDLNGFTLIGGTGHGIAVTGSRSNIVIRNGMVRGWLSSGVDVSTASSVQLEHLSVLKNGFSGVNAFPSHVIAISCMADSNGGDGIVVGEGSTVQACVAGGNGARGIVAGRSSTVNGCSARGNGSTGISAGFYCTVISCASGANSNGIVADAGCLIKDCTSSQNSNDGIRFLDSEGATIRGCTVRANTGDGIEVGGSAHVVDNTCGNNGASGGDGAGIHVTGSANRIDHNQTTSNDRGIDVDGSLNLIIRNSCSSNTTNYDIAANNYVAPTLIPPLSGAFTGDTGGSGTFTNHPWANFSY